MASVVVRAEILLAASPGLSDVDEIAGVVIARLDPNASVQFGCSADGLLELSWVQDGVDEQAAVAAAQALVDAACAPDARVVVTHVELA